MVLIWISLHYQGRPDLRAGGSCILREERLIIHLFRGKYNPLHLFLLKSCDKLLRVFVLEYRQYGDCRKSIKTPK